MIKKEINLKKTSVAWMPEIPANWDLKRGKFLFKSRKVINDKMQCSDRLGLTLNGVIDRFEGDGVGLNPNDFRTYQIFNENDLVFKLIDLENKNTSRVGFVHKRGIMSSAYIRVVNNSNVNMRYFYYQYFNLYQRFIFNMIGQGVRATMSPSDLLNISVAIPPLEVQNSIVEYLDKKNNEIEKFIRNKERLIELLEEEKQSVIRKGVTKGLNAKNSFKEIGIDWVGEIPENWNIKKLKFCSNIIYGISPHENTYNDKGVGSVLVNGPVEYSDEYFGYTRELKWTTDPKKFAPKDALLFCLRGSTTGRLNICHADVSIGRGVAAIISKTNQDFMVYAIKALVDFISDSFKGSTFPSVTSEDLNNYLIPLPTTMEEEIEIVKFLNEETKIFDVAISKAQKEISSIKEYREALITDLVTGKRSIKQLQAS